MSLSIEPFNEAKYKVLMDRLKFKEMMLSDMFTATNYFRMEAEYYNAPSVAYRGNIKGKDVTLNVQYGTSKLCDEMKEGYPVLRLNELQNCFVETPQKYCPILSAEEFAKLRLRKGDVLIIRTNGNPDLVGRSAVVLEDTNCAFASYLYRVNTNELINAETLVAYLNCKYGRYEIDKNSIKGNQTNFSPAKFHDINIPKFGGKLQKKVKKLFNQAYKCKSKADSEFLSAEQLLISRIEFDGFCPDQSNIAIKSASKSFCSSGRLDAEYYQPCYDSYKEKLRTTETVQTLCNLYDKNYNPKEEFEYQYIELADVGFFGNISNVGTVLGKELPSRARRQVRPGQVIVASVEGSLQSCALIPDKYNNMICSTGFYVLDSDVINSETLLVLFKSEPIQTLMKQRCSGTILTAITKDELLSMPLPKVDSTAQKEIASKVQKSFSLRSQAEQLLEYAKQAVEIAIEQDDKTALEWLREKGVEN